MGELTIGRIAEKARVSRDTVRYYERLGLIKPLARTHSNYRLYSEEEIERLRFIKRAQNLGFSLSEIKKLLLLQDDPSTTKAEIKAFTEAKIREVRRKILELTQILQALEHLAHQCDGHGPIDECPILEVLRDESCHPLESEASRGGEQ